MHAGLGPEASVARSPSGAAVSLRSCRSIRDAPSSGSIRQRSKYCTWLQRTRGQFDSISLRPDSGRLAFQRITASRANARIPCRVSRLWVDKMTVCRVALTSSRWRTVPVHQCRARHLGVDLVQPLASTARTTSSTQRDKTWRTSMPVSTRSSQCVRPCSTTPILQSETSTRGVP